MKQTEEWKAVLIDGVVYEKQPDGILSPAPGRMNYDRIDRMTVDEVEALAGADDDGPPAPDEDWAAARAARRNRLKPRKLG